VEPFGGNFGRSQTASVTDSPELGRAGSGGPPLPPELGAPLETVNAQFHEAYDRAKAQAKRECPVFVLLADSLVAFHRGVRSEYRYSPDAFHALKAVAHVPVAIYAELQRLEANELSGASRERLERLRERTLQVQAKWQPVSAQLALTEATSGDVRTCFESSLTFIADLLSGTQPSAAERFANAIGPVLLRLTHEATRLQLESLHTCVERALAPMSESERDALHVVVTGDHQARARSLGMQYFKQRLRESDDTEERVAYAEGVSDEQQAFELVGTRRLDHAVAAAFFGDRKRLQRDILGDSAASLLRELSFEPI
jgi:hypothetical protein